MMPSNKVHPYYRHFLMADSKVIMGIATSAIFLVLSSIMLEMAARQVESRAAQKENAGQITPQTKRVFRPIITFSAPDLVQADPILGFRLRIGSVSLPGNPIVYTINNQGFRGSSVDLPKPRGTYRILALGGSTTFGWGVKDSDTYPSLLEALLNDRCTPKFASRIEVVNGGVPGYVSAQNRLSLERKWLRYQPDKVLIMDGLNDFIISQEKVSSGGGQHFSSIVPGKRRQVLLRWRYFCLEHSAAFRWSDRQIRSAGRLLSGGSGVSHSTVTQVLQENLDAMEQAARANQFHLAVIIYPGLANDKAMQFWQFWKQFEVLGMSSDSASGADWYNPMADFLAEWARSRGMDAVDLRKVFHGEIPADNLYQSDGIHFTPEGNALLAKTLYDRIFQAQCGP